MSEFLDNLLVKWTPRFSALRRLPGVGAMAHRISYRVLSPDRLVWYQVRQGPAHDLWLKLRLRTGADCYNGAVEPALQEVLAKHIRPGMIFYDLGANIGFFSLLAARLVGAEGKVFSFEADPEVADRLQGNAERNGFTNIRVIRRAVWSFSGSVPFSRVNTSQSPDRGCGKVVPLSAAERTIEIGCVSLDDFVRNESAPHFIKCDVEGAESEVFRGALGLLAERKPLLACEVHSNENRSQVTQILEILHYSLDWFTSNHVLAIPPKSS